MSLSIFCNVSDFISATNVRKPLFWTSQLDILSKCAVFWLSFAAKYIKFAGKKGYIWSAVRSENWYQDQFRYGEFKNRGPKSWNSLEKSEEEEREEKTKNAQIATKIGTKINFGTGNSKIVVPSSKNLQKKVKKKKKKKKRKILRSQRKLVSRSNLLRQIQKSWSQILKILKRKWRRRKRRKNEKCSDRNENWYQDQFRYSELKCYGPEP